MKRRTTYRLGHVLCVALMAAGSNPARADTTALRGLGTANEALAWRAIGRLDAHGMGFCTATLIDPETVLTAAHCVFSPSGEPVPVDIMVFRAGLRDGSAAAESNVVQIEVDRNYRAGQGIDAQNVRHDVALLRLGHPIPTHEVDPFLVEDEAVRPGPVSVVSYGRGRENVPSRQANCQVLGTSDDIVMMDCDVTFGSSGAPVFSHRNGRGRIVSLISGMGNPDGRRLAYGMALPEIVADLRHRMRANALRPTPARRTAGAGAGDGSRSIGARFVRP